MTPAPVTTIGRFRVTEPARRAEALRLRAEQALVPGLVPDLRMAAVGARAMLAAYVRELDRLLPQLRAYYDDCGDGAETAAEYVAWRRGAGQRSIAIVAIRSRVETLWQLLGYCPRHGDAGDCTEWHDACDAAGCVACGWTGRVRSP